AKAERWEGSPGHSAGSASGERAGPRRRRAASSSPGREKAGGRARCEARSAPWRRRSHRETRAASSGPAAAGSTRGEPAAARAEGAFGSWGVPGWRREGGRRARCSEPPDRRFVGAGPSRSDLRKVTVRAVEGAEASGDSGRTEAPHGESRDPALPPPVEAAP